MTMPLKFNQKFLNLLESLYVVFSHSAWVQILTLPLTGSVLLSKLLNCFAALLLHLSYNLILTLAKVLQRQRTHMIYIDPNVDRFIMRDWLMQLWRLKCLMTCHLQLEAQENCWGSSDETQGLRTR